MSVWCLWFRSTITEQNFMAAVFDSREKAENMMKIQSFEGRMWIEEWTVE